MTHDTTFTPGPWIALEDDDMWGVYPTDPDRDPIVWQLGGIDNAPDARLIAAAPDLYAACEAMLGAISLPLTNKEKIAHDATLAALAKARGGAE